VLVASRRMAHRGFSRTIVRGGELMWTRGHKPTQSGHSLQRLIPAFIPRTPAASSEVNGTPINR
jgi:hypothetical protein